MPLPIRSLVFALSFIATTARAQVETSAAAPPAESAFESAGIVETRLFIPEDLMNGRLHTVGEEAENDGLVNTYTLSTGTRGVEVTTSSALRARIREIYAISQLRGMSKTDEFGKAMTNAGKQKLKAVGGIVRDPVGTIKRVPKGASRFFGRIGESMKGGGAESEGTALQGITGVDKAKVALAVKLGVNPYSTNEELQEELTNTARAMAGGGFVISGATAMVGGPVITALNVNQNLQQTLVSSTPSDLRIINRKKLFAMGVDREHADEFLMHPWYSPWHETIIVDALDSIGQNPRAFLDQACRALTEQDADYFQRLAQVLARYHKAKARLSAIVVEGGIVCGLDSAGTLVVPLSCDYANWNEHAAGRVDQFVQLPQTHPEIKGLALWVDGKVSETAARELQNRKVEFATDVLESLKSRQQR